MTKLLPCPFCGVVPAQRPHTFFHPDQPECLIARAEFSYKYIDRWNSRASDDKPAPAVPDGWVCVPKQPTKEMLKALSDVPEDAPWRVLWLATISAAPLLPIHQKVEARTAPQLQPIETAPRDGSRVLLYAWSEPHRTYIKLFGTYEQHVNLWKFEFGFAYPPRPTHWMPLPPPPNNSNNQPNVPN